MAGVAGVFGGSLFSAMHGSLVTSSLTRGYFCRSSGNVTDEVIKAYIENQCHDHDATFSIEGEASPDGESPSA
jgi:hypothetical protein